MYRPPTRGTMRSIERIEPPNSVLMAVKSASEPKPEIRRGNAPGRSEARPAAIIPAQPGALRGAKVDFFAITISPLFNADSLTDVFGPLRPIAHPRTASICARNKRSMVGSQERVRFLRAFDLPPDAAEFAFAPREPSDNIAHVQACGLSWLPL